MASSAETGTRRLAAVMVADVAGYSRLMEADERATIAALRAVRTDVWEPVIAKFDGRIVKLTGDGFLAEFSSVVHAVSAAIAIQDGMAGADAQTTARPLGLRIGINVGDVVSADDDLYGDGINVAARLEGLAAPGGICISDLVYRQVRGKLDFHAENMGLQVLKNIAEPLQVYRVRAAGGRSRAPASQVKSMSRTSIAVLPFLNLSSDADQAYFCDGLAEDIIMALSRFHELFVFARSSSFAFRSEPVSPQEIGAKLNARYIVEGSVRRQGDTVRIAVSLLDTSEAKQIWAEKYDRDIHDISAVSDDVTRRIVSRVTGRVAEADYERVLRHTEENAAAYDCWLRGQHALNTWTPAGDNEALASFERAIATDPHFARAHSSIAGLLNGRTLLTPGHPDRESDRDRAMDHALRAVEYDAADGRGHMILAWVHLFRSDHSRAHRHFGLAEELNPNAADTLMNCACGQAFLGQVDHAKDLVYRAFELNPYHADWYFYMQAMVCFLDRDYGACAKIVRSSIHAFPELVGWTTAALAIAGRDDESRAEGKGFIASVAARWAGAQPCTPQDAFDWFLSVNHYLPEQPLHLLRVHLRAALLD
ncbi:adenylate/guanylate cyclase domain-containing protein [soil metagenome]